MKPFDSFRIITNGKKYRIEGEYYNYQKKESMWIALSKGYYGANSCGFLSVIGGIYEFDSKEQAVNFISKEYGEYGIRKLKNTWTQV